MVHKKLYIELYLQVGQVVLEDQEAAAGKLGSFLALALAASYHRVRFHP